LSLNSRQFAASGGSFFMFDNEDDYHLFLDVHCPNSLAGWLAGWLRIMRQPRRRKHMIFI